jgi:uncharacterized protein YgbK (DUF1537 family)
MLEILIIADDLTGAADTGVCFLAGGPVKMVDLEYSPKAASFALAVDTESRNAAIDDLPAKMKKASELVRLTKPQLIYKKIDSCLRGQIGLELEILIRELALREALIVPAYPALGRISKNGLYYVDGCLVSESASSHDPLRPVLNSSLKKIINQGSILFHVFCRLMC